eukprot:1062382-Rhodomonas_salina.2
MSSIALHMWAYRQLAWRSLWSEGLSVACAGCLLSSSDRKRAPHLHPRQRFQRLELHERVLSCKELAGASTVVGHDKAVLLGQAQVLAQPPYPLVHLLLFVVVDSAPAQLAQPAADGEHQDQDQHRDRNSTACPPAPGDEVSVPAHAAPHHALTHVLRTLPPGPDHSPLEPLEMALLLQLDVQHRRRVLRVPRRHHLPRSLFRGSGIEVHHLVPPHRPLQARIPLQPPPRARAPARALNPRQLSALPRAAGRAASQCPAPAAAGSAAASTDPLHHLLHTDPRSDPPRHARARARPQLQTRCPRR